MVLMPRKYFLRYGKIILTETLPQVQVLTRRTWIKLDIPMNIYIWAKVKYSDRNRDVGMAFSLW